MTGASDLLEATVLELQAAMAGSRLSATEITQLYLDRIAELNPLLGAVIETNPEAIRIAGELDAERSRGLLRGPLHGIPVLIKDNIATRDSMQTTAGSLALVGSRVPRDAPIVEGLRTAGAIILGKANLSEWANFRGFRSTNGWSARGGFTRNPYDLSLDPSGSSSGSAVAVAANLTAIAVGTETDGSITSPAAENAIVGLKPTHRPRVAGGHHPHRPLAGHGRPDVPDGHRCRAAARRPALAVRRGSGSAGTITAPVSTQARSRAYASPTTGATPTASSGHVTTICSPWSTGRSRRCAPPAP